MSASAGGCLLVGGCPVPSLPFSPARTHARTSQGAIQHAKRCNDKIFPNKGFFAQLLEFEKAKRGSNSLSMSDYPAVFEKREL